MSMDSLSMTPPMSPLGFRLEEFDPSPPRIQQLEEVKVVCFNCTGEVNSQTQEFHADSYWMSKYLSRVCIREEMWHLAHDPTVELFSYTWQHEKILSDQFHKLTLFLRQTVSEIQAHTNANTMFLESAEQDLMGKRSNIIECLEYISGYISRYKNLRHENLEDLVGNIHTMLLYIGRLTDLPSHVTMTTANQHGNKSSTGVYHSFHIHLDVYWRVLVMLYTLEQNFPDYRYTKVLVQSTDQDLDVSLFDQIIQLVLWDLVSLACQRYIHRVSNGDYTKVCMFSCTCVQEMWLLVLKILEVRLHKHGGQSFWISLHQVLTTLLCNKDGENEMETEIDSDVFINPPDLPACKDTAGLCLWIISNVAPLYNIHSGDKDIDTRLQSNYHDVENLLKKILDQPSLTEARLRHHLKTCLQLSSLWEPTTGLLVILWEYYYRRLNNSFQLSNTGVEGLASINQTVSGLYSQCKKFVSEQPRNEQETSFQLFLRLLALHLGRLFSEGAVQEWKQMKGRFYSKFHQRRIQNLSEGGLYNLTGLFLTIAMVTDVEDVGSKLCDFYDMLDIGKISYSKRSVVWCGAFTLMTIYSEKQIDVGFLADKMASALDNAVSKFASDKLDSHHSLWKLILLYLEGTQEIFDTSQSLHLSEYKLIRGSLKPLLQACSDSELRTTLAMVHGVINRINEILDKKTRSGSKESSHQHKEVTEAIWSNIYPFVKDHSMTLTPPPQLADLAAGICLMALKSSTREHFCCRENFLSVFQHFALGETVNVILSCRFLGHVLSSREVIEKLEKDLPNYQTVIIKAWFRCALHISDSSHTLVEVTRIKTNHGQYVTNKEAISKLGHMTKMTPMTQSFKNLLQYQQTNDRETWSVSQLEEVKFIFTQAEMELSGNLDLVPVLVLKAIERAHKKMQTWKEKMEFKDRILNYFSDVTKQVSMVIKNHNPPEAFSNVYRMTGYLVKYCAALLFIESKPDCPLPSIVDSMMVPYHVFNPDKPLQPVFLAAVRDTLHLFIQGLSKLDYKKSPYVQRRLKDIVTVYLPKFPFKSSSLMSVATGVHPVVASLSNSYTQHAGDEAIKFRHFLLQLVIDNFIVVKKLAVHPSHAMGISFVHEVLQRTTNTEILARDASLLLSWLLEYVLLLPDTSSSLVLVTNILQSVMEACVLHSQVAPLSDLSTVSVNFIQKYFKFSSEGLIRVMEKLAVLHRYLAISVIKKLSAGVQELEAKRGVGIDKRLRHKYYSLLKLLGPSGEAEIKLLQTEDI